MTAKIPRQSRDMRPLSPELLGKLKVYVAERGTYPAAKRLRVGLVTLDAAIAGLALRADSYERFRAGLE